MHCGAYDDQELFEPALPTKAPEAVLAKALQEFPSSRPELVEHPRVGLHKADEIFRLEHAE